MVPDALYRPKRHRYPMKKFGLIGHPIAHSLSPHLFKAAYDGKFTYDLIEGESFEESYTRFLEEYDGINVTAPFKELAFKKADIRSQECDAVGATNLLIKTPEGIKAYNSDYLGVRRWLEESSGKVCPENDRTMNVLVVGYGGAGKAVAAAARSLGMSVTIMNRTIRSEDIRPLDDFCTEFRKADIIIYNIPGPIPQLDEITEDDLKGGDTASPKFILEANYRNPSFTTETIDRMKEANPLIEYTEGKLWLLYQAVTGYEIFTGEMPDLENMSKVL